MSEEYLVFHTFVNTCNFFLNQDFTCFIVLWVREAFEEVQCHQGGEVSF
jgi:hypothetical protein